MVDTQLYMKIYLTYLSKSNYNRLCNIGHIQPNINEDAAVTLVHAFISSKFDHLNSMLRGISECVIRKLQRTQNNVKRIVLRKKQCEHITPLLHQLHWLAVKYQIQDLSAQVQSHCMVYPTIHQINVNIVPTLQKRPFSIQPVAETKSVLSDKDWSKRFFSNCTCFVEQAAWGANEMPYYWGIQMGLKHYKSIS